jgi:hypothetical protein
VCEGDDELDARVFAGDGEESFGQKQPVAFKYTVTNCLKEDVVLLFRGSERGHFRVFRWAGHTGFEVWVSFDYSFPHRYDPIERELLAPGETLTYAMVWDQTDTEGNRVTPGGYTVEGLLPYCTLDDATISQCPYEASSFFSIVLPE